jgi:aminoglycoside 6'-N-acetyltransferase I
MNIADTQIIYRKATIDDIRTVTELGLLLYSDDNTYESLSAENQSLLNNPDAVTILALQGETTAGMVQGSIHHDYVEGTDSGDGNSKVGYLEGIFVQPEYRLQGVAKALVAECEKWVRSMGCVEFASDCKLENTDSYRFHTKIGFAEVSRNIHFAKKL